MLTRTQTIARMLGKRSRAYAVRWHLYAGMGWGASLYRTLRPWYLWRVAHRHPCPQVRAVALAMHARLPCP